MCEKVKNNKVKCSKCKKIKDNTEFYESSLLKKDYMCKECKREKNGEYQKEVANLIKRYYSRHKNNKKGLYVKYTYEDLYNWSKKDKNFLILLNQWIMNDYKDNLKPAIIRKNNNKDYTLDNLIAIEKQKVNCYRIDSRARLVKQYDLNGNYIATYPNACIAARILGFKNYTGISEVCKGNRKVSNGYHWTYGSFANIVRKNTL